MDDPSQLFIRTDLGKVFGPIAPSTVASLVEQGMLNGRVEVSLDGVNYQLPGEVAQVRDFFPQALWNPPAPTAAAPMAGPGAMRFREEPRRSSRVTAPLRDIPAPTPAAVPPAAPPPPAAAAATPPPPPEPARKHNTGTWTVTNVASAESLVPVPAVPDAGDLSKASVFKLLAMATAGSITGRFQFHLPDRMLTVYFRKGNADGVDSNHLEHALGAFLISQKLVTDEQLKTAQAAAPSFGGDLLSALMGAGALNPSNAFGPLAQRAQLILLSAVTASTGTFSFTGEELPASRALPLGGKWNVLGDILRKIPIPELKRRLQSVFSLPILKSHGWVEVQDLKLTPQEARALGYFDGVRSLEQLVSALPQEADHAVRLAFLLREVDGVSFVALRSRPKVEPPKSNNPVPPAPAAAPQPTPGPSVAKAPVLQPTPAPQRPAPAPPVATQPPFPQAAKLAGQATQPPFPASAKLTGQATQPPFPPSSPTPRATPGPSATPAPAWLKRAKSKTPSPIAPAISFDQELTQLRAVAAKLKGENHFEILNVPHTADGPAVKLAYFKLAKMYHPDTVSPDAPEETTKLKADIFSAVSEAYRVLADDASRANYIEDLKHGLGEKVDVAKLLAAEDLFQKATILVKGRHFQEALKLLEEAITCNPDEGEYYAWRGFAKHFVLTNKGQAKIEAMADINLALQKNERCAPAHYFLGQIAKLGGDNAGALKHFKHVVELSPDHVDAQREIRMLAKK